MLGWITNDKGDYNRCHFWCVLSRSYLSPPPRRLASLTPSPSRRRRSNFEIGSLAFFRSEAYTKYFQHLDRSGGFSYERWGDAPVHSIAAALFLKPEEIHWFHECVVVPSALSSRSVRSASSFPADTRSSSPSPAASAVRPCPPSFASRHPILTLLLPADKHPPFLHCPTNSADRCACNPKDENAFGASSSPPPPRASSPASPAPPLTLMLAFARRVALVQLYERLETLAARLGERVKCRTPRNERSGFSDSSCTSLASATRRAHSLTLLERLERLPPRRRDACAHESGARSRGGGP